MEMALVTAPSDLPITNVGLALEDAFQVRIPRPAGLSLVFSRGPGRFLATFDIGVVGNQNPQRAQQIEAWLHQLKQGAERDDPANSP